MGNSSSLTETQKEQLHADREGNYKKAAEIILDSDALLFSFGAGFSKDSGLAVYKDIADVKAWREADLAYHDLCQPQWITRDPEIFFGFWGMCFIDYRRVNPHKGYGIIKNWRDQYFTEKSTSDPFNKYWRESKFMDDENIPVPGPFFIYTSNVDNHSVKAGFGVHEIDEIHGNTEEWHCSDRCTEEVWSAPKDYRFIIDEETMRAKGTSSSDKEEQDFVKDHPHFSTNHPKCKNCGLLARPNILMFGDYGWIGSTTQTAQSHNWFSMIKDFTINKDAKLVIVEIGAGVNVPSIRHKSESLIQQCSPNATLIRINPDFPLSGEKYSNHVVSIMDTGLHALENIDKNIQEIMQTQGDEIAKKRASRREELNKPWTNPSKYKSKFH